MEIQEMRMTSPSTLASLLLVAALVGGCGQQEAASVAPMEISRDTVCTLDGMLLADFPGPKAQIHYEGADAPDFFCDTVEMFSIYLAPEQARRVRAIHVQDMGKADWSAPKGHWIDARGAFYVLGSNMHGSMGPTIGAFALEADAAAFAKEHGGKVLKFDDVKADMVVLDGGVLRDAKM
jgi:copper chaperone NosL